MIWNLHLDLVEPCRSPLKTPALLTQELAQVAVDPQPEVAPSAAETVSPPEKRAIRTIEGIVKKMSDVCPAAAAVEDDLSVAESPLCGSALRKRKADIQARAAPMNTKAYRERAYRERDLLRSALAPPFVPL